MMEAVIIYNGLRHERVNKSGTTLLTKKIAKIVNSD